MATEARQPGRTRRFGEGDEAALHTAVQALACRARGRVRDAGRDRLAAAARGAVQFASVGLVEGGPGGFGDSPQHILRLVQDRGVAGLADRHSGAGVRWNRIPDTVRQRVVDKADEVRREAS